MASGLRSGCCSGLCSGLDSGFNSECYSGLVSCCINYENLAIFMAVRSLHIDLTLLFTYFRFQKCFPFPA